MVLEALFRGSIYPPEQVRPETQEYDDSITKNDELMVKLKGRLDSEEIKILEELKQSISIADCEESEEFFRYGLTIGILLMCEVRDIANRYLDR